MTDARKNTLLLSAIIAGLASLPMTWAQVKVLPPNEDAEVQELDGMDGLNELVGLMFVGMEVDVPGLRGSIPKLYDFPFWGTIAVAAIAGLAQMLNRLDSFDVPLIMLWLLAFAGFVTISLSVVSEMFGSMEVSPRPGWFVALYAGAVPLLTLAISSRESPVATSGPKQPSSE